jgi:hypothetical protein
LQRGVDRIAVFIIFSDAPKVGTRAGLNVQEGPHSAGGEVLCFSMHGLNAPQTYTTSRLVRPEARLPAEIQISKPILRLQ